MRSREGEREKRRGGLQEKIESDRAQDGFRVVAGEESKIRFAESQRMLATIYSSAFHQSIWRQLWSTKGVIDQGRML